MDQGGRSKRSSTPVLMMEGMEHRRTKRYKSPSPQKRKYGRRSRSRSRSRSTSRTKEIMNRDPRKAIAKEVCQT